MPSMLFLKAERVKLFSACVRLKSRPAPWGALWFQSSLPSPVQMSAPSRMLRGMSSRSPSRAETAPFLKIMCSMSI